MSYGFVIDQRKCIGCHACTVACKAENDVPLGDFRTWVKYTEKGSYPEVRRHFTVLRCNHCDAAPCVEICPVVALHKRPDAIVDLDRDRCIGCRACMQACPYDALYLNEDRGVAEKCHFCAHRTELGLEPACVVVCPEQAIVAGHVDDPHAPIARLLAEQPTSQRKLEKGTQPRVWYVDALPESLEPGRAHEPESWLWSDRAVPPPLVAPGLEPVSKVVTTLNTSHPPVWGWHIWTYLLTKNVAAGVGIVAPFLAWLQVSGSTARDVLPEIVGIVFLAITSFLLVHDLGRPERFWRILLTPNPRSWLVKGTWILAGFGGLLSAGLLARLLGADPLADALRWVNLPFSVFASGYTAFLFGQCKGRDLWLEKGLFASLVVRAVVLGLGLSLFLPGSSGLLGMLFSLGVTVVGLMMVHEIQRKPSTDDARRGQHVLKTEGRPIPSIVLVFCGLLCVGAGAGVWLQLVALVGFVAFVAGLFLFERAWVRAGQAVSLS